MLNVLRPTSSRTHQLFAATRETGELRAQVDDTDLGFAGFVLQRLNHQERKTTSVAEFGFPGHFNADAFDALLSHAISRATDHGCTELLVYLTVHIDEQDTDPVSTALANAGFELGVEEQMSVLTVGQSAAPQIPDGLSPVVYDGFVPPEEYLKSVGDILAIADEDMPTAGTVEAATWDRQRFEEKAANHARIGATTLNALLVDDKGVAAYSYLLIDGPGAEVAEQEITVTHRRARRRGLGSAVKAVLWQELATRHPQVKRVITYNALTNTGMLAINERLGMKPAAIEQTWVKQL